MREVTLPISAEQYALILKAFGLYPRAIPDGFPHETDLLLFGPTRSGSPRPPIVAGYFEKGTDQPDWYTNEAKEEPIDMVPMRWISLEAFDVGGLLEGKRAALPDDLAPSHGGR